MGSNIDLQPLIIKELGGLAAAYTKDALVALCFVYSFNRMDIKAKRKTMHC